MLLLSIILSSSRCVCVRYSSFNIIVCVTLPVLELQHLIILLTHFFLSAVAQVSDGIRYLHSVYVVHRDIKPGNVLIWTLCPERVDAKLADYGVSQFYTPGNGRQSGYRIITVSHSLPLDLELSIM